MALVFGKLKEQKGQIEGEMGRSKKDFRKQALVRGKISVRKERYSLSHFKVKKELEDFKKNLSKEEGSVNNSDKQTETGNLNLPTAPAIKISPKIELPKEASPEAE